MSTSVAAGMGEAAFQELLERMHGILNRIETKMGELFRTVNSVLSKVPGMLLPEGLVERVQALLERAKNLVNKFLSKVGEYLESPGLPSALREAGDQWSSDVGGKLRETGDDVSTAAMKVGDYWRGNAANAYRDTLDRQGPACDEMSELTRKVDDWLGEAASAIENFWISAVISAVSLAAGVVTCIAACLGVVTTPAGIAALIAGALGAIAAFTGGLYTANHQLASTATTVRNLKEEAKQNATFGMGWPPATAEGNWKAD